MIILRGAVTVPRRLQVFTPHGGYTCLFWGNRWLLAGAIYNGSIPFLLTAVGWQIKKKGRGKMEHTIMLFGRGGSIITKYRLTSVWGAHNSGRHFKWLVVPLQASLDFLEPLCTRITRSHITLGGGSGEAAKFHAGKCSLCTG